MTDTEILEAMRQMLEPINLRVMNLDNRISNLDNRITNLEYEMRKGIRDLKQDNETIMTVLEGRNLLPKAQ